jgi:hypothetical protein
VIIVNKRSNVIVMICLSILVSMGLFAKPESVKACSCAGASSAEQQVKDELSRKTAIFAGKVTQVKPPRQQVMMSSADLVKVTFEVSRVWKGELGQEAIVYTAMSSSSCGIEDFEEGVEYIVSAYGEPTALETNICDLTKPLASAEAETMALGAGVAPIDEGEQSFSTMSLIVAIATILIGGVIVIMINKLRKMRS